MGDKFIYSTFVSYVMQVETALSEYGLSETEIDVYVNLLKVGESSLQEISKRCKAPRTTTYNTLNYLITKGLVSKVEKEKIAFYVATDPHKMKDVLERKKLLIEQALPELELMSGTLPKKTRMEVYEGPSGIFALFMDVFKDEEHKQWFGNYKKLKQAMSHLMPLARKIRMDKKIPADVLIEPTDEEVFHTKEYRSITTMRQTPLLQEFPGMAFIYGNGKKIAFFVSEPEMVGFIIENEGFAKSIKLIFDLYWKMAKPFKL